MVRVDQQDLIPDERGAKTLPLEDSAKKDALSDVERLLQPSDLTHPGVQKMVLDRLDKAEARSGLLEGYRIKYHDTREQLLVAQAELKKVQSLDVMRAALLGVGSLFLGYLPSAWGDWKLFSVGGFAGIAMVVSSFVSKKKAP